MNIPNILKCLVVIFALNIVAVVSVLHTQKSQAKQIAYERFSQVRLDEVRQFPIVVGVDLWSKDFSSTYHFYFDRNGQHIGLDNYFRHQITVSVHLPPVQHALTPVLLGLNLLSFILLAGRFLFLRGWKNILPQTGSLEEQHPIQQWMNGHTQSHKAFDRSRFLQLLLQTSRQKRQLFQLVVFTHELDVEQRYHVRLSLLSRLLEKQMDMKDWVGLGRLSQNSFALLLKIDHVEQSNAIMRIAKGVRRMLARGKEQSLSVGSLVFDHSIHPQELFETVERLSYQKLQHQTVLHWQEGNWKNRLQRELPDSDHILLSTQPVMGRDMNVHHYEILTRFRDDKGGLQPVSSLMLETQHTAEAMRLEQEIFQRAIRLIEYESQPDQLFSLNVSLCFLRDEQYFTNLIETLQKHPKVAKKLILEFTESSVIEHCEAFSRIARQLKCYKVRILIDEVCVFFDSIFPDLSMIPDFVKMHTALVQGVDKYDESQQLVRQIVSHGLHHTIPIYAIGVDQDTEWKFLLDLGIAGGQGFYFTQSLGALEQWSSDTSLKDC
ncbi:EAL domain-containing protein [Algicola sagamiensis]|uniref:EAL domain-containing protein n=1 Tax=Algicola sagamiensis TaxID=163869 RepID=UPI00036DC4B1|nr:EAL domain-containing protein [Algicola sagamiensis]